MADNVDHNMVTLNGHNTVHVMGMMGCLTPGEFGNTMPIMKRNIPKEEILALSKDTIIISRIKEAAYLKNVTFHQLHEIKKCEPCDIDMLYSVTKLLHIRESLWSGTMQAITRGPRPGVSSFFYLPMIIYLLNCIYSTLVFVKEEAAKHECFAVCTFDQPLFIKALKLVKAESSTLHDIFVRLGGLHTIMCF